MAFPGLSVTSKTQIFKSIVHLNTNIVNVYVTKIYSSGLIFEGVYTGAYIRDFNWVSYWRVYIQGGVLTGFYGSGYSTNEIKQLEYLNAFEFRIKRWVPEGCLYRICKVDLGQMRFAFTSEASFQERKIKISLFSCLYHTVSI